VSNTMNSDKIKVLILRLHARELLVGVPRLPFLRILPLQALDPPLGPKCGYNAISIA